MVDGALKVGMSWSARVVRGAGKVGKPDRLDKTGEIRERLARGLELRNTQIDYPYDITFGEIRYLLDRLERAEALLRTVNAAISRDDSYLDVGADIDDYFRSQTSEEK